MSGRVTEAVPWVLWSFGEVVLQLDDFGILAWELWAQAPRTQEPLAQEPLAQERLAQAPRAQERLAQE